MFSVLILLVSAQISASAVNKVGLAEEGYKFLAFTPFTFQASPELLKCGTYCQGVFYDPNAVFAIKQDAKFFKIPCVLSGNNKNIPMLFRVSDSGEVSCQLTSSTIYYRDVGFVIMTARLMHPPHGNYVCITDNSKGKPVKKQFKVVTKNGILWGEQDINGPCENDDGHFPQLHSTWADFV